MHDYHKHNGHLQRNPRQNHKAVSSMKVQVARHDIKKAGSGCPRMDRQSHCKHSCTEDTMPNHKRMIKKEGSKKENSELQGPEDQMQVTVCVLMRLETGRQRQMGGGCKEKTHSECKRHMKTSKAVKKEDIEISHFPRNGSSKRFSP